MPIQQPIQDVQPRAKTTNASLPRRDRRSRKSLAILASGALIIGCLFGTCIVFLFMRQEPKNLDEVEHVKSLVGRHFVLPASEEPAMFTVTDKTQITTEFLKIAENGDKVLVYQVAKRIVIYRPNIDKVVDVGPVVIADEKAQDSQEETLR